MSWYLWGFDAHNEEDMSKYYPLHRSPLPHTRTVVIIFLLILMFGAVTAAGCIKVIQQYSGSETPAGLSSPLQNTSENHGITSNQNRVLANYPIPAATAFTTSSPDLVTDAPPVLTPDPYPGQHATQITISPEPNRHVRYAEFEKIYVLRENSTGLIVNATVLAGPLWIYFNVKPLYDCLEDPESCRGTVTKSINRPYFTLTVRDNQTRAIVAEDGYGREYSSQKTNRTVKIYSEGWYHLTLTGSSVDVTLFIATGAAPNISVTQPAGTGSSQTTALSPKILRRIQKGGNVYETP